NSIMIEIGKKIIQVATPTPTPTPTPQNSKSCQRNNPDCEKTTCASKFCNDGCEMMRGTIVGC
ncbi:MAG: hypothetical protein WCK16_02925, partial [Candidatus Moraniibacteriota bacterium]